jgi:transposase
MPRAYSVDLREKALAAVTSGRSVAEVAALFGVSRESIYRWRNQQATTGSMVPGTATGRPRALTPEQEADLVARVAAQPDATLAELCAASPVSVSTATMSRTLDRLDLRRKKRV